MKIWKYVYGKCDVDVFGNQCNTITICLYIKVWSSYNIDLEKLTKYTYHKIYTRLEIISCYWKYETFQIGLQNLENLNVQIGLQNLENLNFQIRLQKVENLNLQVEVKARIIISWALKLSL
jgi:hypothetical protein